MIARPSFLVAFLVVLMMCAASSCSANMVTPSGSVGVEFGTSSVRMVDGVSDFARLTGRSVTPSVVNGVDDFSRLLAKEAYSARVGGNAIAVTATRAISAGSVATAAVALGGSFYAGWQVGSVIADALGITPTSPGVRCFPTASGWTCDLGTEPTEDTGWAGTVFPNGSGAVTFYGSPGEVCSRATTAVIRALQGGPTSWTLSGVNVEYVDSTRYVCNYTLSTPGDTLQRSVSMRPAKYQKCSPSIDALNPAYSVSEGAPPDPDGYCRTGRYTGTPAETVAKRLADFGNKQAFPRLAEDVLNKGGSIPAEGARTLSGTPSVKGEPTTKTETSPDGKVRTETKTGTTHYTYSGDKITYNVSYTTIINNDGDITTVEEGGPGVAQDGETDCEKFPEIIGCSKYGDPPGDDPSWTEKEITFDPVDLGFAGSCPAPTTWVLPRYGITMTWSYQPACDVAGIVRAALLAITALGAAMFIVRTVKP